LGASPYTGLDFLAFRIIAHKQILLAYQTRVRFPGRVRPKDFKSWYSQLPRLAFSI